MLSLSRTTLESLRDQLRARGQRQSMVLPGPATSQELVDAMRIVEEWGAFVEAMYLVMAADKRVLNVEREVLRGALAVLSDDVVRTRHMEAMLDAAMRKVAEEGAEKRLEHVIEQLRRDPARAEIAAIVGAAVAAADQRFPPEEHAVLAKLFSGLGVADGRAEQLLSELTSRTSSS